MIFHLPRDFIKVTKRKQLKLAWHQFMTEYSNEFVMINEYCAELFLIYSTSSFSGFCTGTRFKTKAHDNSEKKLFNILKGHPFSNLSYPFSAVFKHQK